MITVLTGALALFALALAGVLGVLGARAVGLRVAALAAMLGVAFVVFAIVGDRRERRCLDRLPPFEGFRPPEELGEYTAKVSRCREGKTLGLNEPFG